MRTRSPAKHAQRGIALVMVLWLTVLIAVIGSSFAYSMRGEALAARNTMSLAQARAVADGAVERTAYELARPRVAPEAWVADGQPHTWNDGDIVVTATANGAIIGGMIYRIDPNLKKPFNTHRSEL